MGPASLPLRLLARSLQLIVKLFNISFLFFHVYDVVTSLHEFPSLSTMDSSNNRVPRLALSRGGSASLTAFARPTSAGVKRTHVALPVSPTRRSTSGHRRPHHAHGKVARVREETAPSPPRFQDDGDTTRHRKTSRIRRQLRSRKG